MKRYVQKVLYFSALLAAIPALIMTVMGIGMLQDSGSTSFLFIGLIMFLLVAFVIIIIKNSDKKWARFLLSLILLISWAVFFFQLIVENEFDIFSLFLWNVPISFYLYLIYKEN